MTVRESPSDIRRKRAALLLVFSVFAIALAIHRLPVPAAQPATAPSAPTYAGVAESRSTPDAPALPPDIPRQILTPAPPVSMAPRRSASIATAVTPPAPFDTHATGTAAEPSDQEPPAVASSASPALMEPLPSRPLRFDASVPVLVSAHPTASPYGGGGIGAAGHAVGRAFGIAGRQIVTAFRRTGDAVKGAF